MSNCVEKQPHECGTSDALQIFKEDGKYTGFCFACDTYVSDPYGGKAPVHKEKISKTDEEIKADLASISSLPTVSIPSRALRKESLEYFDVKVALSEQDGATPVVRYFPFYKDGVFKGYKCKLIPVKRMWGIGNLKGEKDFFGWQQAMATESKLKLFITEGEDDAVALYQAIKDKQAGTKYAALDPAVVSLTNGSGGAKRDIAHHLTKITQSFREVILVFKRTRVRIKTFFSFFNISFHTNGSITF